MTFYAVVLLMAVKQFHSVNSDKNRETGVTNIPFGKTPTGAGDPNQH